MSAAKILAVDDEPAGRYLSNHSWLAGGQPHHLPVMVNDRVLGALLLGELGMRHQMPRLAMHRQRDHRLHQRIHAREFVLRCEDYRRGSRSQASQFGFDDSRLEVAAIS